MWCADLDVGLAQQRGKEFGIRGGSPDQALADELGAADLVVNLTPPAAHAAVSTAVLHAGKHVYVEKPLATSVQAAMEVLALAAERGLQVGGAPDWILSRTCQVARSALAEGRIGEPIGVTAFASHSRVESWHPNPQIFFRHGGGPVLDIGPYYISALADLLGPINAVAAIQRRGQESRAVTAPNRLVNAVGVEVDTHSCSLLRFTSGVIGTLTLSFDTWERTMPFVEIYGTEGTLALPMPHEREGEVKLKSHTDAEWASLTAGEGNYVRGLGVVDMAEAIRSGRHPVASGVAARHVVEVLTAINLSGTEGRFVTIAAA